MYENLDFSNNLDRNFVILNTFITIYEALTLAYSLRPVWLTY